MSTATSHDMTVPLLGGEKHFLLRRLHSLTGLIFGGYLIVHLLVNATIAQMGSVYQAQVNKIHDLPLLIGIEWAFIFLPIIYHIIYGIWITLTGQPNVNRYGYAKNWFYLMQRVSAIILIFFMVFHVLSLKFGLLGSKLTFDPHNASFTISQHMKASPAIAWVIYPVGILASCYHLANGLWTAAITWGLTISAGSQRRWGYVCAGIFVLTMVFGFTALCFAALGHFNPIPAEQIKI